MKFDYPRISRSLIAFLFVIAGYQKLMQFSGTAEYIGSLGLPLSTFVTILVIFIEIVIALLYAWGYRVCYTGGILVVYTILATLLVHHDLATGVNMIMALKNIAIIGGILATTGVCSCGRCYTLNPKA